jgi:hypothetical protein
VDKNGNVMFEQNHRPTWFLGLVPGGIIDDMKDVREWEVSGWASKADKTISYKNFTFTNSKKDEKYSGKLSYNFPTNQNDYIVLTKEVLLYGKPSKIGVWIYGDNSSHLISIRFTDKNDETYQTSYEEINWIGWKYVEFPINNSKSEHWGGDRNGIIDYPIKFTSLILDDFPDTFMGNGTIFIGEIKTLDKFSWDKTVDISYMGPYPASAWQKDDIIAEEYDIKIPNNIKIGTYYIKIGLYDELSNKSLLTDDRTIEKTIGEIKIVR